MTLDQSIRDRVIFMAGQVAGVDCPNCEFRSRDVELDRIKLTEAVCPECETTILTEEQQSQLRQTGKL